MVAASGTGAIALSTPIDTPRQAKWFYPRIEHTAAGVARICLKNRPVRAYSAAPRRGMA
jgi:hypothetical protein|tara:strand:- start:270 stop:446 length:177 start_codon:yes stop_codon:yes gene_type:complete